MFVIMDRAGKLLKINAQVNPPHEWVDNLVEAKRFMNQTLATHYNRLWLRQRYGYIGTEVVEE